MIGPAVAPSRPRPGAALRLAALVLATAGAAGVAATPGGAMELTLRSPDFAPHTELPTRCSCEGEGISPALSWSGAPDSTAAFALIVDDPDAPDPAAPRRTWVHWVLYDLPADAGHLPAGVNAEDLPAGTREGLNDWKATGYGAACPPIGRHRYFFKLYALDAPLGDLGRPTKAELEAAMAGHVLARAELVGTYRKQGR